MILIKRISTIEACGITFSFNEYGDIYEGQKDGVRILIDLDDVPYIYTKEGEPFIDGDSLADLEYRYSDIRDEVTQLLKKAGFECGGEK